MDNTNDDTTMQNDTAVVADGIEADDQQQAGQLSADPVAPLPETEQSSEIVADTAESQSGAIAARERPEWPYRTSPPMLSMPVLYRAANSGERPDGNEFHAAVVTKVNHDWTVNLTVLCDGRNPMFVQNVTFDEDRDVENIEPGKFIYPRYF